jgi:ketosteroid isomerase-like protein
MMPVRQPSKEIQPLFHEQHKDSNPLLVRDENVKEELRRSLTQSGSAFNRGDVEALLQAYAPDAVVLPPDGHAVHGIVAIRQLWASLLLDGYCNAVFELDRIEHWGNVAITIGRYKVQIPVTHNTFEVDCGKYVGHWHRMPDGQFRVTLGIWHSDRWQRLNQELENS